MFDLPPPRWVCLRTRDGKMLARFDAQRGILEISQRGEFYFFDLLRIVQEMTPPTFALLETPSAHGEPGLVSESEL